MTKKKRFSDEDATNILFELDRIKSGLLQIAEYPASDDADKNDINNLIEKYLEKIAELEKAVKE